MPNDPPDRFELVTATKAQLDPLLRAVIDDLDADANAYPMSFFSEILIRLRALDDEASLLQLFIDLSATAFQGFIFTDRQAASVDVLLERCESIAFTMTASGSAPH